MADQNLDTVRGAYEAFARGDVPAVLAILADDIEWSVPPPLPQAGDAHGRDEVGAGAPLKAVEPALGRLAG